MDRKTGCFGPDATGPVLHQKWVTDALKTQGSSDVALCRASALSYSLVRGAPLHAVVSNNLGALSLSTHAPHFQHHLNSPDFRSKCFLSSGFIGCASAMRSRVTVSELGQPSPVTVVPLVALPPPGPRSHREQFR